MGFPRFCGSSLEGNVRPWRNLARFLSQALDDYKNPNREGKREPTVGFDVQGAC